MTMQEPVSVTWLNRYVASLLERDSVLAEVRVRGELSNCKTYASGHLYFMLKDEEASVSCVMFRREAAKF
jgi:exodeoxyribonuclease VII large subunit